MRDLGGGMGALGAVVAGVGRLAAFVLGNVVVFGFADELNRYAPGWVRWLVDAELELSERVADLVSRPAPATAAAVMIGCGVLATLLAGRSAAGAYLERYLGQCLYAAAVGAVLAATVAAFVQVADREWRTVMYFPVVVLGVLLLTLLREVARAVRQTADVH